MEPLPENLPTMEVPRMTKDELREFVLGLVDGRIYTSAHLGPHGTSVMGVVFMPLSLGALSLPEEVAALIPEKPPEPAALQLPLNEPMPEAPTLPPEPKPPDPPDLPDHLVRDVDWGRLAERELEPYKEAREAHEATVAEWRATVHSAWETECERIRAEHEAATAEWEAACREIDERGHAVNTHYFRDIGLIWEHTSKAGPRGINGHPIFTSCRIMHREDWAKAHRAAEREEARRKEIDFDDDDDLESSGEGTPA